MSVHTPSRALTRVNAPDDPNHSILLGYAIGSGDTEEGDHIEITASGKLVRFRVLLADGRRAEYDLDISAHAGAAVELARAEA